jgi:cell division protein FtsW (lipid II flippase)
MAVTYVFAGERHRLGAGTTSRAWQTSDGLLPAATCVAIVAVLLATTGRLQTLEPVASTRAAGATVNLNSISGASQLEAPLRVVFADSPTRQFAARELLRFVSEHHRDAGPLPNVGALARATVRAAAIDESSSATAFADRLRLLGESARAAGRVAPDAAPLLTAAELAAVKPFLVVRTRKAFRNDLLLWAVLYVVAFHLVAIVWRLRKVDGDRLLLASVHVLTAIGFALLISRSDPLRDTLLFVRFAEATVLGIGVMTIASLVDFRTARFLELSYLPLAAALLLSTALILFGAGPGSSRAKVNLGPVQPIEAIRLLLALFLAGYFARRWELLRGLRGTMIRHVRVPGWMNLPRVEDVLPVAIGVAAALLLFFVQKDLGPALFLCCVFLAVYAVARDRVGMAIVGLVLLVAGFYIGYRLEISATLADRVAMWQSPWENRVGGGDQVAHAMWALATGGIFGTGLGLGDSRYLPAGHTDLVLAALGEELGIVGLLMVTLLFTVVAWRGLRIARLASSDYAFFLATALTLFLLVPALIMAVGITGLAPLTGVVTPFLSYGGSAMVANFAAIGILASIHAESRAGARFEPFRRPMRWLRVTLAIPAVALFLVFVDIQVLRADDYVAKPHLGVQADGGRRFQYNPRLVDVARQIPRGTIYDRNGLPLASEDNRVIAAARATYERLGVSLGRVCPAPDHRCYPLGGPAFHLLGDARTRLNWSAANTSYVERDVEDTLRGFDDHATIVETLNTGGKSMAAVRRDYRELVPLLRHRYDVDHPAVVAAERRPRDVTLTIDAPLQLRTAAILRAYAEKSGGKAAAVVLDPDTGDLLAVASYPWPTVDDAHRAASRPVRAHADALLDRARYGLYPPGSTFKLVTAVAALREDPSLTKATFTCRRLSDGRTGARIDGWTRPVRDDVLDTHPHGTIDLGQGLVRSCNAYFAQLGARLGPGPLAETAAQLGISLTPAKNARQRVRETLPQVANGQAEVLATPLRMARVAAAIAADGVLREPRWQERSATEKDAEPLLDATAARLLGTYMRDAVLVGTGRVLRSHPARIAGKTGTAELAGRPSHSWFVGFAPSGPATRRIAFAVVVENAGYGASTAAPAAGEIVSAAAAAGLIK